MEIFKDLGVDKVIAGGQTMNPSTEDILGAIDEVNAKTIYVFPNNKNIVMAANQARDLTEDKESLSYQARISHRVLQRSSISCLICQERKI